MLRVHLVGGQCYEGKVYAVDPVTLTIVLSSENTEDGSTSYKLINPIHISHIEGDLSATPLPNIAALGISSEKAIQKREQDSLIAAEKGLASLNSQVEPKIQELFDAFNKTLPCRWDGNNMIILDTYIISSPSYETIAPIAGSTATDLGGFQRLEKMLTAVRSRLGL